MITEQIKKENKTDYEIRNKYLAKDYPNLHCYSFFHSNVIKCAYLFAWNSHKEYMLDKIKKDLLDADYKKEITAKEELKEAYEHLDIVYGCLTRAFDKGFVKQEVPINICKRLCNVLIRSIFQIRNDEEIYII